MPEFAYPQEISSEHCREGPRFCFQINFQPNFHALFRNSQIFANFAPHKTEKLQKAFYSQILLVLKYLAIRSHVLNVISSVFGHFRITKTFQTQVLECCKLSENFLQIWRFQNYQIVLKNVLKCLNVVEFCENPSILNKIRSEINGFPFWNGSEGIYVFRLLWFVCATGVPEPSILH
jgi:hypothetical protein